MNGRRIVLLIALVGLVLNALGCYGSWIISPQARKCCGNGHCSPANHDPCCKLSVTSSVQVLQIQEKICVYPPILGGPAVEPLTTSHVSFARPIPIKADPSPPGGLKLTSSPLLI